MQYLRKEYKMLYIGDNSNHSMNFTKGKSYKFVKHSQYEKLPNGGTTGRSTVSFVDDNRKPYDGNFYFNIEENFIDIKKLRKEKLKKLNEIY